MWNNIGQKLQTVSKVICWIGIAGSILLGVVNIVEGASLGYYGSSRLAIGILVAVIGSLLSWVGAWVTYAIGECAEAAEAYQYYQSRPTQSSASAAPSYVPKTPAAEPSVPKKDCPYCGARNNASNKTCFCCNKDI